MKNLTYNNKILNAIFKKPWNNLLIMLVLLGGMLMATAQTPGIPYQAYIIDKNAGYIPGEQIDVPLANADIVLQFEIRNDKGQVEYIEEIPVKTDEFGMVSTVIGVGNGTPVMGKFSDINWNGKPKKMYTDIDFTGTGSNFKDHGNMDIVYIPGPGGGISETTTTLKDNGDGSYTYTNEDGTTTTFSVPQHNSGDPNTLGTEGNVGDIYVDESTGAMYMHGGSSWVPMNTNSSETTTTLVDNGDGIYTYTSEDGTVTNVNTVYSSAGNGDPITNNVTGKVGDIYIDRSTGEVYVHDGNTWVLASSSETTTTLVDNNNGTYTYTSEDGTTTTYDVTQSAVGDPNTNGTTGNAGDIYVDESTGDIYVHNGTTWVPASAQETLTTIVKDDAAGTITYKDENGNNTVLDLQALIAAQETTTTLVDNADGTLTYTSEDGTTTTFDVTQSAAGDPITNSTTGKAGDLYVNETTGDIYVHNGTTWVAASAQETTTTLVDNADGTLTYTSEDGTTTTFDVTQSAAGDPITNSTTGKAGDLYVNETTGDIYVHNGTTWVAASAQETTTTLVDNADGTLTYTSEDGTTTTFDVIQSGTGNPTTNGLSGKAGDVYVDEATGDFYVHDGTTWVSSSATETNTTLAQDGTTGVLTYTNENGTVVTAGVTSADSGNLLSTGSDGGSYINQATIKANETLTSIAIDNTAGTITYTDEAGSDTVLNISSVAVNETTTTSVQDNATGVITYTDEDGNTSTADVTSADANNILVTGTDGGTYLSQATLAANETTTTSVQNDVNGVITYTNEDGTVTTAEVTSANTGNILSTGTDGGSFLSQATLAANETTTTMTQDNTTGDITYTNEDGTVSTADVVSTATGNLLTVGGDGGAFIDQAAISANETVTSSVQNDATGVITYTDEDGNTSTAEVTSTDTGNLLSTGADGGSFIDQATIAANETVTTLTKDDAAGTLTYTDEDGTANTLDFNTLIENAETTTTSVQDNTTGVITYTNEDGTATTADVTSTDTGNLLSTGADGGSFIDQATLAANETTTTSVQDDTTGVITYTNEDGTATTAEVTSIDSGNLLSTGSDGGSFINQATIAANETLTSIAIDNVAGTITYTDEAGSDTVLNLSSVAVNETTTTSVQDNTTGVITYTDEDGNTSTADVTSIDTGNLLSTGSDGGSYLNASTIATNETTTTSIQNNTTGVITYTNEDGTATTADVTSADANNILVTGTDGGTYLSQATLTANETTTTMTQDNTTGDITYTNEDGTATVADVVSVAAGNLITVGGDGGAFIDQAVLAANETTTTSVQDDTTGVITYTNEDGTATTAEVTSTDTGNLLSTGADGGSFIDQATLAANETTTTSVQDDTTGVITYTNEDGTATTAEVTSIDSGNLLSTGSDGGSYINQATISANETLTTLAQNATAGTLTYTDEDGMANTLDLNTLIENAETLTTLAQDDSTGVITYTDEDGTASTAEVTSVDTGNLLSTGSDGGSYINQATIAANETLTSIAIDNTAGTITYTDEAGSDTVLNISSVAVNETTTTMTQDNTTGDITYTDEDGNTSTADVTSIDTGNLLSTGSDGGSYLNASTIATNETTTTSIQNNTTGVITYTNEDGTATTADVTSTDTGNILTTGTDGGSFLSQATLTANETTTTMTQDNTTGDITYTNEDGTATVADVVSTAAGNLITVGADGGAFINQTSITANETVTTLAQNATAGTLTYTDEDGTANTLDLNTLIENAETTTTSVQDDSTGVITYTNEDGTATTAEVTSTDAGNILSTGADGGSYLNVSTITSNETTTTSVQDNTTGVITYTNEDGTATTADVTSTDTGNLLSTGADGGSFIDQATISANETVTTLVQDATAGTLTYTDENGAANTLDLNTLIETAETTTSLAQNTSTGVITYTDEDTGTQTANVTSTDTNNILVTGTDGGTYLSQTALAANETTTTMTQDNTTGDITYTNEDGTATVADVVSTAAGNLITVGGDGGAFIDQAALAANETTTTSVQNDSTGVITYTNEDGTATTAEVTSANTGNLLSTGTDGGSMLTLATLQTNETTTTMTQDNTTGDITYTNEDGTATVADVVSTAAGNLITVGADGGAFINQAALAANETTTTSVQNDSTGVITYTNEDGTATTAEVTSADTGNLLSTGTDGGSMLTLATLQTNETTTTSVQDNTTGVITYTNEDGTATTADVTSTDTGNVLTTGADGGSFLSQAIISANETVTTLTKDDAAGTLTYTDEDGTANTLDLNTLIENAETNTTMVQDDSTGVITYTDEDGATATAEVTSTDTGNVLTTGADGGSFLSQAIISANETVTTLTKDDAAGTLTYTDEDGTANTLDLNTLIENAETNTTMVQDDSTGVITYTDEDGATSTAEVTSTDTGNLLSTGADGGSFIDQAKIAANETTTTSVQDNTTGVITYTNEDGTATTADVTSTDTGNVLTTGADGGSFLSQAIISANETVTTLTKDDAAGTLTYTDEDGTANTLDLNTLIETAETTTSLAQNTATGVITYTDEDAGTQTANVTSTDTGNLLSTGADGGSFIDQAKIAANETTTTMTQDDSTGDITYTNEDGTATVADVVSVATGNLITVGSDGGAFINQAALAANETTTTSVQNDATGVITYTNEDGTATTAEVTSTDTGNLLSTGADGGSFIDQAKIAANETTTTMTQDNTTGDITYTNEDGTATTADVVSTAMGNLITVGADGGSFIDQATIQSNETVTTLTQDATAGTLIYTDEDGTANTLDLNTLIENAETNTTMVQDDSTGVITHTDEDGTTSTAEVTSTDTGNLLTTGADGGSFIDQAKLAANETTTSMVQDDATGVVTYTDEDGATSTAEVTSTDTGNLLTTGADGGSFIDQTALNEPWFGTDDNAGATLNTEDMYVMGNIGVGTSTLSSGKVATFAGDVDIQGVLDPTKIIMSGDGSIGSFDPTANNQYEIEFQEGRDLLFRSNNNEVGRFKSVGQRFLFANPGDFATPGTSPSAVIGIDGTTHSRLRLTAGTQETYSDSEGASIDLHGNDATANAGVLDLVAGDAANAANPAIKFWTNTDGSTQQTAAVITGAGDVGIGTTTPAKKLHVVGQARITEVGDGTAADSVMVRNTDGDILKLHSSTLAAANEPWFGDDDDAGATTNTEDIYHMGQVGLNVTDPTQRLDVNGAALFRKGVVWNSYNSDQILFGYNGTADYKNAIRSRHHGSNDLYNTIDFYTWDAGTDAVDASPTLHGMTVTGGRVGVSHKVPETFLHVQNTNAIDGTAVNNISPVLTLERDGTAGTKYNQEVNFAIGTYEANIGARTRMDIRMGLGNTSNVDRTPMTIRADGRVGINERHTPEYNLDVNGTFRNTGAGFFTVMGGGDDDVADTTAGGLPKRGIRIWHENDSNWGMYMSRSGAGRSMSSGTAVDGGNFSSHAIRFRVANNNTQGFIFENAAESMLLSIQGGSGLMRNKQLGAENNQPYAGTRQVMINDRDGDIHSDPKNLVAQGIAASSISTTAPGTEFATVGSEAFTYNIIATSVCYGLGYHHASVVFKPVSGFKKLSSRGEAGSSATVTTGGTGTTADPYWVDHTIKCGHRVRLTVKDGKLYVQRASGVSATVSYLRVRVGFDSGSVTDDNGSLMLTNKGDFTGTAAGTVLGIEGTNHGRLRLTAGSSDTRNDSQGASIDLHGNTATANTGKLDLVAGSAASGTNTAIRMWTNTGTAQQESMVITGDGNVGIGIAAPTEKLEIDGTIKATDINFTGLPTYADEAAAIAGGLATGDMYKTAGGELRIKL